MEFTALQDLIRGIPGVRVICVGDVMVDRFVYGEVTRLSAEAPIPVLARRREMVMLGAAGNVARNVSALGGQVALVGVIGSDIEGREALRLVGDDGRIEGALVTDTARPTTLKTRFISGGHQLLRVDVEETDAVSAETSVRLARAVRDVAPGSGVIILSDYGKGVVTDEVIAACRNSGLPVLVDSKARSFQRYGAVDVIKPNASELARASGLPTGTDAEVEAALARALELCEARAILVTRAAQGMSLAVRGQSIRHFPGTPREVFDASGAGDTAIAALGTGLAAGKSIEDAIAFALLASGVAVGKVGTATVTPDELVEAALSAHMAAAEAKVATVARMVEEIARWRARGLRVGFTNGCFDILHRGHVAYLAQARSWCDRLIVGVNSDRSVRALKGEGRPVNDLESRALVLAGLASVDLVAPFDEDTPLELIRSARPDVLIKGADYAESEVVGGDLVRGWGGEVRLAPLVEGYSTTAAIRRMAGEGRE
ncbi:MAG: D-glycero-beta-D-manno-heptose 1-phosphate adenylyltransferase [Phenylobacterium sp.]|uniref:D-glycero-beta-D-manno-heptose 1-phosphate adenylyltransferase n=1 Tax=Phenylobacterium sp. TaxID=1871053 RepID=UPI0025DA1A7A|nr:D-glycero-beta-D-manno-heptose 1-phosphate adenylyltransferase [Phenylobacterium sp.]MCA6227171.1 D-glycero-beta-D-manno-heptose 1-phosphate adenylyltransferase [Phenylobacterium sp.]MCA6233114.1 D-glycero-beta-D-manno-heptose 1-phosphate adenylyltransferase [Phenylobacterium sp.]MCA6234817.1 D-glycero-beta-D-manno-heptose 1-phosphate adenylyltransferase [Phenylobacterium sp.]MCA6248823.1 D-glycero-beta-D-manno-heptose 1-phosphate adenylyltransferase [Phenylobacterium sp.]MCA6252708.1 D-gly